MQKSQMTETAVWLLHTDQKQSGMPSRSDPSVTLKRKTNLLIFYYKSQSCMVVWLSGRALDMKCGHPRLKLSTPNGTSCVTCVIVYSAGLLVLLHLSCCIMLRDCVLFSFLPSTTIHTCITFKTVLEHCQSFLAHRHDNKLAKESYWAVLFYASILGQNDDSPWLNSLDTTKNYV